MSFNRRSLMLHVPMAVWVLVAIWYSYPYKRGFYGSGVLLAVLMVLWLFMFALTGYVAFSRRNLKVFLYPLAVLVVERMVPALVVANRHGYLWWEMFSGWLLRSHPWSALLFDYLRVVALIGGGFLGAKRSHGSVVRPSDSTPTKSQSPGAACVPSEGQGTDQRPVREERQA
jgi:hypothetical protein